MLSSNTNELLDALPVGVAIVDSRGKLLFVNRELEHMLGYERGALSGAPVETLVPAAQRVQHVADRTAYTASPTPRNMGAGRELFAVRRDGTEVPVEVGLRPMRGHQGEVIVATVIDVSERKRAESNQRLMFAAAPYGMLLVDTHGRMRLVNDRLCALFDYSEAELLGQPLEMLLPERSRTGHAGLVESFLSAPVQRSMGLGRDLTGRRRDGVEIPIEIGLSAIRCEGSVMAMAAVVDITERKRAELQLRAANAQLEEFTYVSSHDLRSPIRGIGSLLEFIREDYGADAPASVTKNLDRIGQRVKQMEHLIDDLLNYARAGKRSAKVSEIDLTQLVHELLELEPAPAGMQVDLDLQAQPFTGARIPLSTVLRNLYTNAIKHHDRAAGTIRISARDVGSYCCIAMTDDGPGIPENARARVFRLFQTLTASERRGSGLGLAVTKRLVDGHGGQIVLRGADDQRGCTFEVSWPRFMRSDLDE